MQDRLGTNEDLCGQIRSRLTSHRSSAYASSVSMEGGGCFPSGSAGTPKLPLLPLKRHVSKACFTTSRKAAYPPTIAFRRLALNVEFSASFTGELDRMWSLDSEDKALS